MKKILTSLLFSAAVILLAGCSPEGRGNAAGGGKANVGVTFDGGGLWFTKAIGNTHNVDRLLLMPFSKIDLSGGDVIENFEIEMESIRQVEVESFPITTTISLSKGTQYLLVGLGYNHESYDIDESAGKEMGLVFGGIPSNIINLLLGLSNTPAIFSVPQIFRCFCYTFDAQTIFTASDGLQLGGVLMRMMGGLSVEIDNIPDDVTSISLRADMLTRTIYVSNGAAAFYDQTPQIDTNLLGTQAPVEGSVSFDTMVYSTHADFPTTLYLDVVKGAADPVRFEVKVNDESGVSLNNALTFRSNSIVSISGDYNDIDKGFTIEVGGIDLDSGDWDGLD